MSQRTTTPHGLRGRTSQGFSLIEVLVAIIVLALGMLGTVGMQAFALQSNREARLQAQATMLASELAEMMRGNRKVAASPGNPYLIDTKAKTVPDATYCTNVAKAASGCTSTDDVARADLTDWLARVEAELPQARVVVCFDSAPYDDDGLAQWACKTSAAASPSGAASSAGAASGTSGTASSPGGAASSPGDAASSPSGAASGTNDIVYIKMGWARRSTDSSKTGADNSKAGTDNGKKTDAADSKAGTDKKAGADNDKKTGAGNSKAGTDNDKKTDADDSKKDDVFEEPDASDSRPLVVFPITGGALT